ncbi:MAG: hypothetical protein AAFY71_24620 [Bacteroidota bacterium]
MSKKVIFGIIGAVLGVPLSYYFQPEMVKAKTGGIGGYLQQIDKVAENSELLTNVIISVVIFTLVGVLVGYFIDKNAEKDKA